LSYKINVLSLRKLTMFTRKTTKHNNFYLHKVHQFSAWFIEVTLRRNKNNNDERLHSLSRETTTRHADIVSTSIWNGQTDKRTKRQTDRCQKSNLVHF